MILFWWSPVAHTKWALESQLQVGAHNATYSGEKRKTQFPIDFQAIYRGYSCTPIYCITIDSGPMLWVVFPPFSVVWKTSRSCKNLPAINNWATKKTLTTFHYTVCLIGILIMVYYNAYITGEYPIPYIPQPTMFFFIAQLLSPPFCRCRSFRLQPHKKVKSCVNSTRSRQLKNRTSTNGQLKNVKSVSCFCIPDLETISHRAVKKTPLAAIIDSELYLSEKVCYLSRSCWWLFIR